MGMNIYWGKSVVNAANTNRDGTGSVVELMQARQRCWVDRVRLLSAGTNAVCVGRIFVNNGQSPATPTNNILFEESTLPATTASEVSGQNAVEIPVFAYLDAGERILAAVSVDLTSGDGYYGSVVTGDHRSDFESA